MAICPSNAVSSPEAPPPGRSEFNYDLVIQRLIPGYASLARLAVALLSASPLASARNSSVLVAGCGTGAELLESRAQRPDWQLTAMDPSAEMLAVAKQRVGEISAIEWRQAKLEDLGATERFDGALAILVLQSLPDNGAKLNFLSTLARALRPGGQLFLVDLMGPEWSPLQRQMQAAWQDFQRASSLLDPSEAISSLSDGLHPIGRARLSSLADAAGFGDPAPVFRALDFEGFLLQRRG